MSGDPIRAWKIKGTGCVGDDEFDADEDDDGGWDRSLVRCMICMPRGHRPSLTSVSTTDDSMHSSIAAAMAGEGWKALSQKGEVDRAEMIEEHVGGKEGSGLTLKVFVMPRAAF